VSWGRRLIPELSQADDDEEKLSDCRYRHVNALQAIRYFGGSKLGLMTPKVM
jgi:hypothetical protein